MNNQTKHLNHIDLLEREIKALMCERDEWEEEAGNCSPGVKALNRLIDKRMAAKSALLAVFRGNSPLVEDLIEKHGVK